MILTTHAVVGPALTSFLPSHPTTAFAAGFASHFVLDAIPRLDYPIKSRSVSPKIGAPVAFDKALLQDVVTIGFDGLFGMLVSLLLFGSFANFWAVLMGAVGAMLPDPLQLRTLVGPTSLFGRSSVSICGPTQRSNRTVSSSRSARRRLLSPWSSD
jgi:hypothetical protein